MASILLVLCGVAALALVPVSLSEIDARAAPDSYKCEVRYEAYKSLGEQRFVDRYRGTSIVSDCLKMYKDPGWNFAGKSAIDRHYDKIAEKSKADLLQPVLLEKKFVSGGKYSVAYKMCAKDKQVAQPAFLVSSKFESFLAVASGSIPANGCKTYSVQVKSPSSDISVKYVPNLKDPALKSLRVTSLGTV